MKHVCLVIFSALLIGSLAGLPSLGGDPWSVKTEMVESCSCLPACPCLFGSSPTKGYCEGNRLVEIKEGHYGDVRLDGISFVLTFRMKEWTKVYISDKASKNQMAAIKKLLPEVGFVFGDIQEVARVPLTVERGGKKIKFKVPASKVEVALMTGRDDKPITIQNLTGFDDYTQYKAVVVSHKSKDGKQDFEYSDTNGFLVHHHASSERETP